MRDKNTSQLPRLLCCTIEKERKAPLAGRGGIVGLELYCIIGPCPDRWKEQGRGWGLPEGVGHPPPELGAKPREELRGGSDEE